MPLSKEALLVPRVKVVANRLTGLDKLKVIISEKDYVPISEQVKNLANDLMLISEILKDFEKDGFDDSKSEEAIARLKAKANRVTWIKQKLYRFYNIKHEIEKGD